MDLCENCTIMMFMPVMILETWNNRGYYHLHIMMHLLENNAYRLMKSCKFWCKI